MKPEWRMQDSGHVITPGLRIAEIQETAPGYPSIIPGSTLGGKTVINEWRRLAGLSDYSDVSPIDMLSCNERERAFENALSGGFVSMKWPKGSLEYSKAYHAWLEWFVSSEVALAKSCKQVIQDFDELIRQTSERRRFIVTSDGQMGFGPERCEKGDVIMVIPGGKVPYALRKMEDVKCTLRQYRLLGGAFIDGAMAGEKISQSMSEITKIIIV
ncbi:related to heterokaryon incompatibility protein (het-6OR allele) [Fusarium proliferatum]|nr:related to heterokaryon incompatibility protein (het-6OR allele) [Fusarium proliferatum]